MPNYAANSKQQWNSTLKHITARTKDHNSVQYKLLYLPSLNSLVLIQFTHTKAKSIHLCLTLVRVSMTLLFWDLESPKLWTLKAQILKSEEPATSHTPVRKGSRRRVKDLMAQSWDSDLMCGDKDRSNLIDWHLQFLCTRTTEAIVTVTDDH